MNEKKRISVGIIGCGKVTQFNYANTFPVMPNIKVKFVFDIDKMSAQKTANIFGAIILSPTEIYKQADAIIIATPPQTHFQLVSDSLSEDKIIICEKPFVGKHTEAEVLVENAKMKKSKLYVAHFRRMFPHLQLVRSLTKTNVFGRIKAISIAEGGRFSWEAQSSYVMSDPLGGVLFDIGSHAIDMALFATMLDQGAVSITLQNIIREKAEPAHEIKSSFTLHNTNGAIEMKIHFSRYQVLANLISIEFEQGRIQFSTGLSSHIRIQGKEGSAILRPAFTHENPLESFAQQYINIFSEKNSDVFLASRFINLTTILETIING